MTKAQKLRAALENLVHNHGCKAFIYENDERPNNSISWGCVVLPTSDDGGESSSTPILSISNEYFGGYRFTLLYTRKQFKSGLGTGCSCEVSKSVGNKHYGGRVVTHDGIAYDLEYDTVKSMLEQGLSHARSLGATLYNSLEHWLREQYFEMEEIA